MTSETTEWRRGGDPANPPIDRVGVWAWRSVAGQSESGFVHVECMCSPLKGRFVRKDGEVQHFASHIATGSTNHEWRHIGPADGTEQPEPSSKGDREAFEKAYHDWRSANGKRHIALDTLPLFLLSPAGRAAVLKLWGESSLASQLEEARKEIKRLRRLYETEESQHGSTVDDRDHREEQVTAIYHALGGENEWSNCHDLGEEALELAQTIATERDSLKKELSVASAVDRECQKLLSTVGIGGFTLDDRVGEAVGVIRELRSRLSQCEGETEKDEGRFASGVVQIASTVLNAVTALEKRIEKLESRQ